MTPILNSDQALAKLQALARPWAAQYLAMYSSQWQGIITEPWLMCVPLDDHLVHRGDGVFEAMRCEDWAVYQLDGHLERLQDSANAIFIKNPISLEQLKTLCLDTIKAGGRPDCLLRIYLSRGPGSLTANPFDSFGAGLYIVAATFNRTPKEVYEQGVKVGFSRVPIKLDIHARVKSCSYLPNVLVKHDAAVNGWSYALWVAPDGVVGECASENFIYLDQDNRLIFPSAERIIEGLTVRRVKVLAQQLLKSGQITDIVEKPVLEADLLDAREIMIVSTSIAVLPASYLQGRPVGAGQPGPVARALNLLMLEDIDSQRISVKVV